MADAPSLYACDSCRVSKIGCDKSRPQCMRCLRRGRECTYTQLKASLRDHASSHHKLAVSDETRDKSLPHLPKTPARNTHDLPTVKRRNRIPKACLRCRQLKVKCDRQEPCGRCLRVDGGRECHYPTAAPLVDEDSGQKKESVPLYKQTFHSELHWSGLVENIYSLLKYRRWRGRHGQHAEQERLFSSVDNIFGNIGPLHTAARRTLLSYIPPRNIAASFVDHYLNIIEPSHQLLHVPSFKEEVESFWDKPSMVDDGWLAQFFAILALGCQLHIKSTLSTQHVDFGVLPDRLFDAAQVCLQRTPFMIRPELTSIRTLCLFVILKQMKGMVCIESDALWPATGLIVRLAVILGLHSTDSIQSTRSPAEPVSVRNALWAAVILLDLRQSLAAGMPVIPPSRDLMAEPLFRIDHGLPGPGAENLRHSEFAFPLIIYDILPQIFRILELATCPQVTLAYSLVATYDRQIRGLLKYYRSSLFLPDDCTINNTPSTKRFQWTVTNVFFRRVLLALHSRLYQEPQASSRYPVSYWSSLECSIALLSEQRELWDASSCPSSSSELGATTAFYARLFQPDFFLAAVTVCFHLVQGQSSLASSSSHNCQRRARRTILDLLGSCKDIWGREKGTSVCHSSSFGLIDSVLQIMEASPEGPDYESEHETTAGMASCMCNSEGDSMFYLEPWVEGLPISAIE